MNGRMLETANNGNADLYTGELIVNMEGLRK